MGRVRVRLPKISEKNYHTGFAVSLINITAGHRIMYGNKMRLLPLRFCPLQFHTMAKFYHPLLITVLVTITTRILYS